MAEIELVGLGAICDRAGPQESDGSQSFRVGEFALLDSGDRLLLHDDRGFTLSCVFGGPEPLRAATGLTPTDLIREALNVSVLPDEWEIQTGLDEDGLAHWRWIAKLIESRGLCVAPEQLRALPYKVLLTDGVLNWLEQSDQ